MRSIGNKGEDIAVKLIKKKGYKIIERNFNVPNIGEIDIIAKDKDYIVFVEVRLRKHTDHGTGAETVDYFKQKKLTRTAQAFLKMQNMTGHDARFDVVSISGDIEGDYSFEIIKNAFDAVY